MGSPGGGLDASGYVERSCEGGTGLLGNGPN